VRVARWILGIAVAVVLLAVAAALLATLVINPDRYRGDIERAVSRETGRPFLIEGHLRLTWFPWLGVRMGAAHLGNPAGTAGPALLEWQSAQAHVRLLPLLLHRQLEIGRIVIAGADIHLRRGPDGRGNWEAWISRTARSITWMSAATST
jgi:AsmA protein